MKIGIDASRMVVTDKTGVEVYSHEIIIRLVKHANQQKPHKIVLYTPKRIFEIKDSAQVSQKIITFPRLWTQIRLSLELLLHPVDVLFVPSHVLPLFRPRNSVITIHDTAFRYFREAYSFFQFNYLNWSTRFACKKAIKIIVPSNATAQDLKNLYRLSDKKISVIQHGPPEKIEPRDIAEWKIRDFFEQFGLEENDPFILFIGRLETKKNLVRLVKAFSRFLNYFPEWKLILAGKRGVGFSEIIKEINEKKLWKNIIMPGYVNCEEKHWLYEHCKFFVFPSLYEGFGLPVLEAFEQGVPVISSSTSSLTEVCGNACEYINPKNSCSISRAMQKLAKNTNTRESLIRKSKKQLENFSWDKAARDTWEILTLNS